MSESPARSPSGTDNPPCWCRLQPSQVKQARGARFLEDVPGTHRRSLLTRDPPVRGGDMFGSPGSIGTSNHLQVRGTVRLVPHVIGSSNLNYRGQVFEGSSSSPRRPAFSHFRTRLKTGIHSRWATTGYEPRAFSCKSHWIRKSRLRVSGSASVLLSWISIRHGPESA